MTYKLLMDLQAVISNVFYLSTERSPEPVFVDLLRSSGIDSPPGRIDSSESITGLH
jgi:hypothetical protein